MEFIPAVAMIALVGKVVDFLRYAKSADMNGVLTQLIAWIAGVVGVMLAAQTSFAATIAIGDRPLGAFSLWDQIFFGLSAASLYSAFKDTTKAVDNTNSAAIPTLLQTGPKRKRANRPPSEDVG